MHLPGRVLAPALFLGGALLILVFSYHLQVHAVSARAGDAGTVLAGWTTQRLSGLLQQSTLSAVMIALVALAAIGSAFAAVWSFEDAAQEQYDVR